MRTSWSLSTVAAALLVATAPAAAGVGLVASPKSKPHLQRIAIPGYPGLLTSTSTRIPGLIAADDLRHRKRLGSQPVADAPQRVERLERRFEQVHGARRYALVILAVFALLGPLAAVRLRTSYAARFGVAIAPAVIAVSLLLGVASAARPAVILPVLAAGSVALALAAACARRVFALIGAAMLVLWLVVLSAWPETAGFSAIGPRPEEAGRFYGVNNVVETVLLTMTLFSGAALGRRALVPLAALAFLTIGWSKAGADGGGLIVFAVAFAVLALRLSGRLTARRIAVAALGAVGIVLALIGIDEATGGRSHVTRAFEQGPAGWAGDLGHRLHISADRLVANWHEPLIVAISLAALALLGRRPRFPAGDALLAGLAVSLLVNDAPVDVAAAGALSYGVLWAWERVNSAPDAPARPDRLRLRLPPRRLRRREDSDADAEHG